MVKKVNKFWGWLKSALITYLKDKAVKTALKKLLGSSIMGGPKAWIITYVVTELYDEVGYRLSEINQVFEIILNREDMIDAIDEQVDKSTDIVI